MGDDDDGLSSWRIWKPLSVVCIPLEGRPGKSKEVAEANVAAKLC